MVHRSTEMPPSDPRETSSAKLPAARLLAVGGEELAEGNTVLPLEQPPVEKPPVEFIPPAVAQSGRMAPGLNQDLAGNLPAVVESEQLERPLWRSIVNPPNLVSMVLHAWVLLGLGLMVWKSEQLGMVPVLQASLERDLGEPELLKTEPVPIEQEQISPEQEATPLVLIEDLRVELARGPQQPGDSAPAVEQRIAATKYMLPIGMSGGGLQGRGDESRGKLVESKGGSPASEQAVARGLRWLMVHQLNDGSWRMNHQLSPDCKGQCSHPGDVGSSTGATALALLPFLGAGNTHQQGEYRDVVNRGLYYLTSQMLLSKRGGDLQEGTMYAQGLSTIVLCEAYAMSGDENLKEYAQAAVDFIVHAQHNQGGWRYLPGQPGDTTSLGWQLMGLKSAKRAGLEVSPAAFYGAAHFLDSVQSEGGARYGYQSPEPTDTMSAIGLLSRMYLGWPREYGPVVKGAGLLAAHGPSKESMYYNYYATQALFHYEGPYWQRWNAQMRDYLVSTQSNEGHEAGSWYFEDPATKTAGRLYHTAMAVLILEVYYRYLPLYSAEMVAGDGSFPLGQ